ncbi:4-hydroxy-3-methylbut-2-enyl diphosphate reductase [Pseudodesulfovibrio methanolicus]|uniref:4-hydroxy-3-methylbut-2-enyl diphosphate reductase n=1 Tax=Pseudodesulfovibrio methanolicus TaxID=3126690 RepID=A0ABZ2IZ42_9BACT
MEVILAETAGFCMGVDMALTKLDQLVAGPDGHPIYILGPIIHNPQVLRRYADKGVIMVHDPAEVPAGAHVVIRAHGITRQVEASLRDRNVRIKDATCPRVKKAQLLIERNTSDDSELLLYGEADHPEVAGLVSYARNGHFVFGSADELAGHPLTPGRRYILAAQTTQDRVQFEAIAEDLVGREDIDVVVLETICDATKLRQTEARNLARTVDFMVVVGGYNSGNTRRLAQVVSEQGTPCKHVETVDELPLDDLARYKHIGVTAGASTPRTLIDKVLAGLESL